MIASGGEGRLARVMGQPARRVAWDEGRVSVEASTGYMLFM
jgi:hypothetical protein